MQPNQKNDKFGSQARPAERSQEEPQLLIDSVGEPLTPLIVDQSDPKKPRTTNPPTQRSR